MDNTIEAPIIATEPETDPAAPASGEGAGEDAGDRSWAETATNIKAMAKTKALTVVIDAIAK